MRRHRWIAALAVATAAGGAADARAATPCNESLTTAVPQPTRAQLVAVGPRRLPLAPDDQRVDLVAPPFSNPTAVTNPLFPISQPALGDPQRQGRRQPAEDRDHAAARHARDRVEPRPVRPHPRLPVRRLQGRRDRGGRARPLRAGRRRLGLVLRRGRLQLPPRRRGRHRRQLAGRQGGPGGDDHARAARRRPWSYRPENIPGLVFEEVTVKETGRTMQGPRGPSRARSSPTSCTTTAHARTSSSRPATASSAPPTAATSRRWRSPSPPTRWRVPMPAELTAPPRRARQAPRVRSDARDVARRPRRRAAATGARR